MRLNAELVQFSEREAQIAGLICSPGGMTTPAIALRLQISHNTVKLHLKRIFQALDIASRAELVAWCLQNPDAIGPQRAFADYRLRILPRVA